MKKMFVTAMFMLAMLAWAAAQQPGSAPNSGQAAPPSSQAPDASQSQPPTGTPDQAGPAGQSTNVAITEGCLGGSNPNYTLTDNAGTTYKLNIPPNKDASSLAPHVGESVQVAGPVNGGNSGTASIDVQRIGKGTSKCSGNGSTGTHPPPKS
ncbi:MAG: hypothetical protein ACRD3Q_10130 [Terriglobales bacterium]